MNINIIFHFLFPRSICTESSEKFRSLQIARFAKIGIIVPRVPIEKKISTVATSITSSVKITLPQENFSDSVLEQISQIQTDLESIISPFSFAM